MTHFRSANLVLTLSRPVPRTLNFYKPTPESIPIHKTIFCFSEIWLLILHYHSSRFHSWTWSLIILSTFFNLKISFSIGQKFQPKLIAGRPPIFRLGLWAREQPDNHSRGSGGIRHWSIPTSGTGIGRITWLECTLSPKITFLRRFLILC
jgi:hypothetical protein